MEGPLRHLEVIQQFLGTENAQTLDAEQQQLLQQWIQTLVAFVQQEQERAQLAQAGGAPGGEEANPQGSATTQTDQAPVQDNELLDETLPESGGGGNIG